MKKKVHLITGLLATLTIATFFLSTIIVELFGSYQSITTVKSLIVVPGLFILIPLIAATGASGFVLSKSRSDPLVNAKKKRMPFIAANGLFILVPAAIFLDHLASAGTFNSTFYAVQSLELLAGATNLILMSLNIRDGLRLGSSHKMLQTES